MTPGEFVIASRMEHACRLLRFSTQSIGSIAETLGYRDVYFFSKQFRARMGVPPTSYRSGMDAKHAKEKAARVLGGSKQ